MNHSMVDTMQHLESLDELDNFITPVGLWPDYVQWESTPFRPSDDIVLLSYGFHFASNGTDMYRSDGWYVDFGRAVPVWYKNGLRIGSKTYDEVANEFGERRAVA